LEEDDRLPNGPSDSPSKIKEVDYYANVDTNLMISGKPIPVPEKKKLAPGEVDYDELHRKLYDLQ